MTAKLTELENKLTAEKNLREQGDDNLQQSFTNLSTTLTTTVNDLRTFVSETRTELLTSLNATNALVNQNSANIQRNLELIQGIQDNVNGNYTAIKDLLESEIAARKSEDIRLEAKSIRILLTSIQKEKRELLPIKFSRIILMQRKLLVLPKIRKSMLVSIKKSKTEPMPILHWIISSLQLPMTMKKDW